MDAELERLSLAIEANVAAWYADEKTHAEFRRDNRALHARIAASGLTGAWASRQRVIMAAA